MPTGIKTAEGIQNKKLYRRFHWIMDVLHNPKAYDYPKYGARGIRSYWARDEYLDFENWVLSHLGPPKPGYFLSRIDSNGDFVPSNLHWADGRGRLRNSRWVYQINYQGQQISLAEFSDLAKIPYHTVRWYVQKRGFTAEQTVERYEAKKRKSTLFQ